MDVSDQSPYRWSDDAEVRGGIRQLRASDFVAVPPGTEVDLWYPNAGETRHARWRHQAVVVKEGVPSLFGSFWVCAHWAKDGWDDAWKRVAGEWSEEGSYIYEDCGGLCRGTGADPVYAHPLPQMKEVPVLGLNTNPFSACAHLSIVGWENENEECERNGAEAEGLSLEKYRQMDWDAEVEEFQKEPQRRGRRRAQLGEDPLGGISLWNMAEAARKAWHPSYLRNMAAAEAAQKTVALYHNPPTALCVLSR